MSKRRVRPHCPECGPRRARGRPWRCRDGIDELAAYLALYPTRDSAAYLLQVDASVLAKWLRGLQAIPAKRLALIRAYLNESVV